MRSVRESAGVSTSKLAALLGRSSHEAVARVERGGGKQIGLPLLAALVHLAVQNGFSAEWLLTGNGPHRETEGGVPLFRAGGDDIARRIVELMSEDSDLLSEWQTGELKEFLGHIRGLKRDVQSAHRTGERRLREKILSEVRALRRLLRKLEEKEAKASSKGKTGSRKASRRT